MEKESRERRRSSLSCIANGGRFFGNMEISESHQIDKFLADLTIHDHVLLYFQSTEN